MDDQRKGFLRTALTEERVGKLERQMAAIIERLDLEIDDDGRVTNDKTDVHVSGVRPPDGGDPDGGRVEQPAAVVRDVRQEDKPRVQASGDRRKRSR
jgi:hypothetical protein